MKCNARKKGHKKLPKLPPGKWGGEGYCKAHAGRGTDHVGSGRCKHHGGTQKVGIASPNYSSGRYSKHLPDRFYAAYEAGMEDPELLNLRSEIALLDLRIQEAVRALGYEQPEEWFQRLREASQRLKNAKGDKLQEAVNELCNIVEASYDTDAERAWNQIMETTDQRRKLVESEMKRQAQLQMMVPADQFVAFMGFMRSIIRTYITDDELRVRIANDLDRFRNSGFTGLA